MQQERMAVQATPDLPGMIYRQLRRFAIASTIASPKSTTIAGQQEYSRWLPDSRNAAKGE